MVQMSGGLRLTRGRFKKKVDILASLPVEVSQMILGQLPVNDLCRCLQVSKRWRQLANFEGLWKPHCLHLGIQPDEAHTIKPHPKGWKKGGVHDHEQDGVVALCRWARVWLAFRRSPAWAWRTRQWRTQELPRPGLYTRSASDGSSLALSSGSSLDLHVPPDFSRRQLSLDFPLPQDASANIAIDDKFLAVTKCNIALIYKKYGPVNTCRFKLYMGIAMSMTGVSRTRKGIRDFVKKNLRQEVSCTCIIALARGSIWLREHGRYKTYVVNLTNERVIKVETHFYRFVTRTYIVSWSRRKLRVDNFSGRNVLKLHRDVNKARANDHILVTFGFTEEGNEQTMETWELTSGKRLMVMPRPKHAFFEIHPSRDILYQLEGRRDYVTSLCPITGKVFWTVKLPSVTDILDWCLRVVCERYLILFQSKSQSSLGHTTFYLLEARTGQLVYEGERPPGHVEHLSDSMLVCKSLNRILVTSFLS